MSKIAIVTDSTANLPRKWVEQYRVHVVPLKVHWGGKLTATVWIFPWTSFTKGYR